MSTANQKAPAVAHRWKFFRAGGFDQALLETGADLAALDSLDQKLWVALSCPVAGIEFDRKTLDFVDTDGDGHIRAPEILDAARWATTVLKDPDYLVRRRDRVPLAAIDEGTEEGKKVLSGARFVLAALGTPEAAEISLGEATDAATIFSGARFNGDGIVTARTAGEPLLSAVLEDVIACFGGETDRSGEQGVTAETIGRFYADARALSDWWDAGRTAETLPFGADTAGRHEIFRSLKYKFEDYFQRCRLAAFDGRAAALLAPAETEYQSLSGASLGEAPGKMAEFPLAVPAAGKPLPLSSGLNPAYADAVRQFGDEIAVPVLGSAGSLSEEGWRMVCGRFAPYESWLAGRPATPVGRLEETRVRQVLSEAGEAALLDLAGRDKAAEPEVAAIRSLERLLRYCRDLHLLVNNFVSFRDFYTRKGKATFQAGTLFLDGRSCDLCVPVGDVARHAAVAASSSVYLAYCDCVRRGGGEKMTIAAEVTAGDSDFLMVGRNGVFYDRRGKDWDATVVRIVEHPIGIRQAFWYPYKRLGRMIGEQFQKVSAARAKSADDRMAAQAIAAGGQAAAGKPPALPPQPFDVARFAGIFAAIGLAVGAIGTALASALAGLFRLAWWQIPILFAGILLMVSGPSVLLAWLKLRKRNLGPILDANGWAVNARARINIPFGESLTAAARLPENAERSLADPFAEKKTPWKLYILLFVVLAGLIYFWRTGQLARWLGG